MALIYVVEDDKNISEIESFALKNSGYITEVFETGKICKGVSQAGTGADTGYGAA